MNIHIILEATETPKIPLDTVPITLPVIATDWKVAKIPPITPFIIPADYNVANKPPATGPVAVTPKVAAPKKGNA